MFPFDRLFRAKRRLCDFPVGRGRGGVGDGGTGGVVARVGRGVVAHDPVVLEKVNAEAGHDLLRPAVALLEAAGQKVEQVVATGDPANTLIDLLETHGCHAVIMAAGAGGGLRAALLGSVTQHLVDHSPVPVTVVRESVPLSDE